MTSALFYDRLQFAVTATFHYLFPQLTIGLAVLIVYLKSRAYWRHFKIRNIAYGRWFRREQNVPS